PKRVTVSDGKGHSAEATVSFTAGAPSATRSTLVASPTTVPADGVSKATLTLTLADANGNPAPGQFVSLSATGARPVFTPMSGQSDTAGIFTATVSSNGGGNKKITATVGALALTTSVMFTIEAQCDGSMLLPTAPWLELGRAPRAIASGDFNNDG